MSDLGRDGPAGVTIVVGIVVGSRMLAEVDAGHRWLTTSDSEIPGHVSSGC